jgi:hypothetical protein
MSHSRSGHLQRPRRYLTLLVFGVVTFTAMRADTSHARPTAKPSPAIYTRSVAALDAGDAKSSLVWRVELMVRKDGSVIAGDGRHLATLTPSDLRALQRQIRKTRFTVERPSVVCKDLPSRKSRIQTNAGLVTWSSPCAPPPHASVRRLEALVQDLIATRRAPIVPDPEPELAPVLPTTEPVRSPTLVTYEVHSFDSLDTAERIALNADGTWIRAASMRAPQQQGVLTAEQLTAMKRRLKTVVFVPNEPPYACAARLEGEASLSIDGVGSYRWSLPCGRVHGSAQSLITELRRLTLGRP